MTNETESTPEDEDGESFTDETDVRVKWLGSVMASFVITAFFGLVYATALGYATLDPITASVFTVLALLVLAAGTWTFGIDLIDKYTGK
jgi:hypothetical protein